MSEPDNTLFRTAYLTLWGRRFGFEFSRVFTGGAPYLDRYIVYIGGPTLRLHKFYQGDDVRAFHCHPWSFMTFPFRSYIERVSRPYINMGNATARETATSGALYVPIPGRDVSEEVVRAWRPHFRRAEYQHIVLGRLDGSKEPFWTFVVTGSVRRKWGFWPEPGKFVYWRDWS